MRTQHLLALLALTACGGDGSSTPDAPRPIDAAPGVDASDIDASSIDAPVTPTDGPVIPATASRVWAVGDLLVDNTTVVGGFLEGTSAAPAFPYGNTVAPPVLIPGATSAVRSETAFDATATRTAFVADLTVAGRFDLYVAGPLGETPTMLVEGSAATPGVDITSVALSPDGTKAAYTKDSAAIEGGYDLYVVNTTGTPVSTRVSPDRAAVTTLADLDVAAGYVWSANSTYLAFIGDLTENGYNQAYVVDTSAATPAAATLLARTDITALTGARGIGGALAFDAANNVYFRARLAEGGQFAMFSATPTGTRTAFALPARGDASAPDASAFAITPDGATLVFQTDSPTLGTYNLFVQTIGQATTTNLTNLATPGLVQHTSTIAFSPDAAEIAVVATYALGEDRNPYVVKLDGTGVRRLAQVPANDSRSFDMVQWSVDGAAIYALGDYGSRNNTHLYKLDPAMIDQAPTLAVTSPVSGDVFRVIVRPAL